jgi:hypothetical protein
VKPPPTLAPYVEATALAICGSLANAAALWAALLKPYRRCCGVGIWAECYPVALWLAHQRLRFLPGTPYFLAQRRAVCLLLPPFAIMALNWRRFLNGMANRPC